MRKVKDYIRYMKICSKSLVIREMQIKTRDIILHLSGLANMRKVDYTKSVWK